MVNLKTDNLFNEDDFVEINGEMKELTIMITLCEYRNLIMSRTYDENTIEKLTEENRELREKNDQLVKWLLKKCPDLKEAMLNTASLLVESEEAETYEGESDE